MRALACLAPWPSALSSTAPPPSREEVQAFVVPPHALGEPVNDSGVWALLNSGGALAGHVFEAADMTRLPGFSGAPIDMLVTIDLDGRFLDLRLVEICAPAIARAVLTADARADLDRFLTVSTMTS